MGYESLSARIDALETEKKYLMTRIFGLEAKLQRARGALRWYADNMRYPANDGTYFFRPDDLVKFDEGNRARQALKEIDGE